MAAADKKTTYSAAEVAALESTIQAQQSQIHAQQAQIDELKRKLEHMNEVFANAQRARFGQSSEQKDTFLGKTSSVCLTKQNKHRTIRLKNPPPIPFSLRHMSGRRNVVRQKC